MEKVKAFNAMIESHIQGKEGMTFINVLPRIPGNGGPQRSEIIVADRLRMNG